ncbi:MAG: GNAT family N-acetyltransferase [Ponticaulis sp.]|nr:GNAT family N-acetyltransferase [Ponticaulis sp.]|tara:strand:- start:57 stop:503 length:447 start_codon:yes stop_codon:yes gene_type:complete
MEKDMEQLESLEALEEARKLLEGFGLPVDDLGAPGLKLWCECSGGAVNAVAGLEIHGRSALFRSLAVKSAFQGNGTATDCLKHVEDQARQLGVKTLYLLTNSAAPFFETRGFSEVQRDAVPVEIQRTRQFSSLCPATATVMHKKLLSS